MAQDFPLNDGTLYVPNLHDNVHIIQGCPDPTNTFDLGDLKFAALGDRLIVREDEFRSGYECPKCGGSGKVDCETCGGTGLSTRVAGARCPYCSEGHIVCPECSGKGGLLAVPEVSQRRPTTGQIVSVGEKVVGLHVGQSVMYSNFAGYVVDLERAGHKVTLRILHEPEILCKIEGHLELRSLKGKTEIATVTP